MRDRREDRPKPEGDGALRHGVQVYKAGMQPCCGVSGCQGTDEPLLPEPYWRVAQEVDTIDSAWGDDERYRTLISDLPRRFHQSGRGRQEFTLAESPRLTGTKWDRLLAAVAEYIAICHDHPVPGWCDEPERSLKVYWMSLPYSARGFPAGSTATPPMHSCVMASSSAAANSGSAKGIGSMGPVSADRLKEAFRELSVELRRQRVCARVYIVGGTAMALGFDNRRQTMDVDTLIKEGHGPVVESVRRIGRRRGWPGAWLNEEAVSAIPRSKDGRAKTVYADPYLLARAASAEHILAMKARSTQAKDRKDIGSLIDHLWLTSAREVFDLHDEAFPHDPPREHGFRDARSILTALWPEARSLERDDRYGYGAVREDANLSRGKIRRPSQAQ